MSIDVLRKASQVVFYHLLILKTQPCHSLPNKWWDVVQLGDYKSNDGLKPLKNLSVFNIWIYVILLLQLLKDKTICVHGGGDKDAHISCSFDFANLFGLSDLQKALYSALYCVSHQTLQIICLTCFAWCGLCFSWTILNHCSSYFHFIWECMLKAQLWPF